MNDLKAWIAGFLGLYTEEDLDKWMKERSHYQSLYLECSQSLIKKNDSIVALNQEIVELQTKIQHMRLLEQQIPLKDLKAYFLDKWVEGNVLYNYQGEGKEDVRKSLRETDEDKKLMDEVAQQIIDKYSLGSKSIDLIPRYLMIWINALMENDKYYQNDLKTFGKSDYWQRPALTYQNFKNGYDCDDKALLMHVLLEHIFGKLNLADNLWRLKVCCSDTLVGGHAYNIWLAEDVEWYTIESTMNQNGSITNWLKSPHRLNGLYGRIWFTFNRTKTFSENDFVFDKENYFLKKEE